MEVLAIVPARGGSKGIKEKNIRPIAGKPLIAWTIETALKCPSIDRTIVTTDDGKIAEIARSFGADVPFLRPAALAGDDVPDLPVYKHVFEWLHSHESERLPDIVVWLRPTAPLRIVDDIEIPIQILTKTRSDSVRSVCLVDHHPYWMKRLEGDRLIPFSSEVDISQYLLRQSLPLVYRLNGVVDTLVCLTAPSEGMLFGGDMRAYVMPTERSVDLDTELDFLVVEAIIEQREKRGRS